MNLQIDGCKCATCVEIVMATVEDRSVFAGFQNSPHCKGDQELFKGHLGGVLLLASKILEAQTA